MKELHVKKLRTEEGRPIPAALIPEILDKEGIPFETVDCVNWEDFPYRPQMKFRIAHTGNRILLNYRVTEESVRAVAPHDNGRVWEDSCAEFFVQPSEDEDTYYNFECNCAGTLLIEYGRPGDRVHAPAEAVASVERYASLGRTPFDERVGACTWELALSIPVEALFRHQLSDVSGRVMRANFYKCGDLLRTPHFLSWNPIRLPKPCFHCPEFFGKIYFDGQAE